MAKNTNPLIYIKLWRQACFIARAINRSSEDNVHKLLFLRIGSFLKQPGDSIGLVKSLQQCLKSMTYMTFSGLDHRGPMC